jgi:choline dehydrogenase-like flavoprotein
MAAAPRPKGLSIDEARRRKWDVIVVGTGMGGATLGLALARSGQQVLFVEKGRDIALPDSWRGKPAEAREGFGRASPSERREWLARSGRVSEELHDDALGRDVLPEVGSGTGGSSALYGMVLERFFPSDFEPGAAHRADPDASLSSLPEAWPVSIHEMRPWYEAAEQLYRVRGSADPLRPDDGGALLPPAPVGAAARRLFDRLSSTGLHPYRLHLACEALPGCQACQGYLCARGCKNDADRIALGPALSEHGAGLAAGCEVVHLEADRSRVTSVVCEQDGRRAELRAQVVVLAAGALATPVLLLRSRSGDWPFGLANGSGLVGRNLMRHAIDIWLLALAPRLETPGDAKAIGISDLYERASIKLGSVQSFGAPAPLAALRNQGALPWRFLGPLGHALWRLSATKPLLAAILEDLPYEANRIEPAPNGKGVRLRYRPGASEARRRELFRSELRPRLRGLGPLLVSSKDAPKALGHACGTCRFGDDARTSVLDRNNRAHELDNLYVVDASFFPSSAGMNPALTIAANALRVARALATRL